VSEKQVSVLEGSILCTVLWSIFLCFVKWWRCIFYSILIIPELVVTWKFLFLIVFYIS